MRDKQERGYFTVEASLLFPTILLVQIMMVYLAIYCFNRCVLEQCAFEAAVRGSSVMLQESEQAYQVAKEAADNLVEDRLLSVAQLQSQVKVTGTEVIVSYQAVLNVPFRQWMLELVSDRNHAIYVERKMSRIRPVKSIRTLEIGKEFLTHGK